MFPPQKGCRSFIGIVRDRLNGEIRQPVGSQESRPVSGFRLAGFFAEDRPWHVDVCAGLHNDILSPIVLLCRGQSRPKRYQCDDDGAVKSITTLRLLIWRDLQRAPQRIQEKIEIVPELQASRRRQPVAMLAKATRMKMIRTVI